MGGGGWLTPRLGCFTPGKDPDIHCTRDGRGKSYLAGVRSPDLPARGESLYVLRFTGALGKEYRLCYMKT